jgi:cytochrome c oxidase subunit 2
VRAFEHSVLDVAGIQNAHIHTMWNVLIDVCGVMYLLVLGFLAWSLLHARRSARSPSPANSPSPDRPASPDRSPDSPAMSTALYAWIALVIAGLFGITIASYAVDRAIFKAGEQKGLVLEVTSQQWWWTIQYQNDDPSQSFQTANEIHLPVDVPVTITLRSPDVIHSFWVPNLHGKQDLIPGRDTDIHLHPTRTGVFRGQCAEFCGAQHAHMALYVFVESQSDFDRWRAGQLQAASDPRDSMAARGRAAFMSSACPLCHTIRGTDAAGVMGPDLTHVGSRASLAAGALENNRGNLAAWIAEPQVIKPGNHMPAVGLDLHDLQSITAYLDGLK